MEGWIGVAPAVTLTWSIVVKSLSRKATLLVDRLIYVPTVTGEGCLTSWPTLRRQSPYPAVPDQVGYLLDDSLKEAQGKNQDTVEGQISPWAVPKAHVAAEKVM